MRGGYNDVTYSDNGHIHKIAGYYTDALGNAVVNDLKQFEKTDKTPWLIYLAPQAPHSPTTPQDKYLTSAVPTWPYPESFDEVDASDKPAAVRSLPQLSRTRVESERKAQLRTIKSVDDLIGRVFDQMNRLKETSNTLAIFTSDNGFLWGEHRILDKRFPYSEAEATPLLVRWPGHITGGSIDNRLVSNVDIMPTLLQAAGITPRLAHPLEGQSILSARKRTQLLIEYGRSLDFPLAPWAAIRTAGDQYTEWYDPTTGAVTDREYYNLTTDPLQLVNLYRDGNPGNDPPIAPRAAQLAALRHCAGQACLITGTASQGP
jgi:arylsulfatase A-like enzyme